MIKNDMMKLRLNEANALDEEDEDEVEEEEEDPEIE